MVFLTEVLAAKGKTTKFWRIQQYLRFSWGFRNRKRNCYKLGIRYVHKALRYSTVWRKLKKIQQLELFNQRLSAATGEHGVCHRAFLEGLARSNIMLDRKVLTDLAIYEPRTFKSLVDVSCQRLSLDGVSYMQPVLPQRDFFLEFQKKRFSKQYKMRK